MEDNYRKTLTEVFDIINHSEQEIKNKIPKKLLEYLKNNIKKDYIVNIDYNDYNWDKKIKQDTREILALIYRDYLVSSEERYQLLQEEKEYEKRNEQELREKYNPDDIFKRKQQKEPINNAVNNLQLIEIKETPWYKRLYQKIVAIFGIQK